MNSKAEILETIINEIISEMKRINYWNNEKPNSILSDYLDAPSFEAWLQHVFIPNALKSIALNEYPESSSVGAMAMREYDYHSFVAKAQNLVALLNSFDKSIKN